MSLWPLDSYIYLFGEILLAPRFSPKSSCLGQSRSPESRRQEAKLGKQEARKEAAEREASSQEEAREDKLASEQAEGWYFSRN